MDSGAWVAATKLPQGLPLDLMQTRWGAILNPLLGSALTQGQQITGINLIANTPKTIQIPLERVVQGWFPVDMDAFAIVKRTLPFNDRSLTLEANATCNISIWVF